VGTSVKSDISDSRVIGIESINIEGYGACNSCHYVQDSPDYNIKVDWWKSMDGKCEKTINKDSQGTITLEKWTDSSGKECARQLLDDQKTFESCA
ncbi:MAG: hypothetical protein AABW52_01900, partial [Nanoarchaeota archaeon]